MGDFNLKDLRKLYSENSASQQQITLCYSKEEVLAKPLKIKDKKELLKAIESKNENSVNRILDDIIDKYIEKVDGEPIDSHSLTSQERQQLLINIRLASGGIDKMNLVHQCPNCEHLNKNISYDVSSMYVDFYEPKETIKEFLEVANGKIKIFLTPITRDSEIAIENIIKKRKYETNSEKQFAMLSGVIGKVFAKMDDIEAEITLSAEEKLDFFDQLTSSDLDKITEYFKSIDFGVKMPFDFKCEKCGFESEENVNSAVFFIS
jgi:hypothetical protein